jgi:hypothetical protein
MASLHRVFVAAKDFGRLDYWLHHPRSVEDLQAIGEVLKPGLTVSLYGPEGHEQPARLEWQEEVNCWIAYPARQAT